ncbi:pyruvate kinase [Candidatus Woesearchaeota archaeon]|nr:pyruvate kinase [Candidatus Woesearchaeota archaeon]
MSIIHNNKPSQRPGSAAPRFTKTKVIATIASNQLDPVVLSRMFMAGMDCVRINTAHGSFEQYESLIRAVRDTGIMPVMLDIKGPEVRIRTEKEIHIHAGSSASFGFKKGSLPYFSHDFSRALKKGDVVFFDNGLIKSFVAEIGKGLSPKVKLSFQEACTIKPNKGVNVPGKKLKIPSLSERDKEAIKFAVRNKASFIALSFTRSRQDVLGVRKLLGDEPIGIIAKIESQEGIDNIDEIIEASDGIMIARGDLGVEIPAQKIPYLQKIIIQKCNASGKIAIVATQVLESMTNSPVPTRAEVSDVANAVLDGADAVMLSGETAIGKYPAESVQAVRDIAEEVEDKVRHSLTEVHGPSISEEISRVAYDLATYSKADKIVCVTRSGFAARLISRFRPCQPVIAVTDSHEVLLNLQLAWGVMPILISVIPSQAVMPKVADYLLSLGLLSLNDLVVFTAAFGTLQPSITNLVEIHHVEDLMGFKKKYLEA